MKITAIKTYKFSVPTSQQVHDPHTGQMLASAFKNWLFLKIETDAGITGWGEGSGEWLVPSVEATLNEWSVLLVDRDPLPVMAVCQDILDRLPWKGGPVLGTAMAAINAALYDIAGKAWGVPVHNILGGKCRDRVRIYTGGRYSTPQEAAEDAQNKLQLGYEAMKGNPLETRRWPMDDAAVDHSVACIAAIRQVVPSHFDILLDTHGSPTPELSVEFSRRVAPHRPLFLEEPVKFGSLDALEEVSRKSPVPVATGEKLFTFEQFKPMIDRRSCAFLQPDIIHCYGISTYLKIAAYAEHQQMLMAPHLGGGPLSWIVSIQSDAVTPNFLIQETHGFEVFEKYVEHDMVIENGHVNVPDRPGLGVEVKEADIAKLPYQQMTYRQYRHEDGSWKGW